MQPKASELLDFYYGELHRDLLELEAERKRVAKMVVVVISLIAAAALGLIFTTGGPKGDFAAIIAAFALASAAFSYRWFTAGYRRGYKNRIFSRLVERIDPTLLYSPAGMVSRTFFNLSGLFQSDIDYYDGGDLIKGKIGRTPIEFSRLKVEKESTDARGKRRRSLIFHGTFIVTEFHKHFKKEVLIYPDIAEKYLGVFGGWLQGISGKKPVRMDSPEFEKEFKVYADDPVEAHYLLTPSVMERLTALKRRADAPLYISFRLDKLFIAIADEDGRFEPPLFRSLLGIEIFKAYIENFNLILSIVEELNLNRRIWSKE